MQIRRSASFRVLVMLHRFNFLQVDGRVLRENLHIVQNSGKMLGIDEAPWSAEFLRSQVRIYLESHFANPPPIGAVLKVPLKCGMKDDTDVDDGSFIHTHTQTQRMLFAVVHYCRNAAGKCLWPWCGTGRSHRKGGAGSGSFRSRSIDASRPSPGFSQDRCSFRIRSRNWARTPRTRIFMNFLHHDACWMYVLFCGVQFLVLYFGKHFIMISGEDAWSDTLHWMQQDMYCRVLLGYHDQV